MGWQNKYKLFIQFILTLILTSYRGTEAAEVGIPGNPSMSVKPDLTGVATW